MPLLRPVSTIYSNVHVLFELTGKGHIFLNQLKEKVSFTFATSNSKQTERISNSVGLPFRELSIL
jgi:hypothetical protein